MQVQYIIAIVCGSVFAALLIAAIAVYAVNSKKEARLSEEIEKMYADPNLVQMKYDSAAFDKETEELLEKLAEGEEVKPVQDGDTDAVYNQLVIDGLEEITGDYKPE